MFLFNGLRLHWFFQDWFHLLRLLLDELFSLLLQLLSGFLIGLILDLLHPLIHLLLLLNLGHLLLLNLLLHMALRLHLAFEHLWLEAAFLVNLLFDNVLFELQTILDVPLLVVQPLVAAEAATHVRVGEAGIIKRAQRRLVLVHLRLEGASLHLLLGFGLLELLELVLVLERLGQLEDGVGRVGLEVVHCWLSLVLDDRERLHFLLQFLFLLLVV